MNKTSHKIKHILKHGFAAVFAFALSMTLGVSGFTQLVNVPNQSLNAEVFRLDSMAVAQNPLFIYLFIAVSAVLLVSTLLYIRWVCKKA